MTGPSARHRLPDRRQRVSVDFEHSGHNYTGGAGLYPDGHIGEVFLSGGKTGTHLAIATQDAAIAASLALQFGCPVRTLSSALLKNEAGEAAGALGRLLEVLMEEVRA